MDDQSQPPDSSPAPSSPAPEATPALSETVVETPSPSLPPVLDVDPEVDVPTGTSSEPPAPPEPPAPVTTPDIPALIVPPAPPAVEEPPKVEETIVESPPVSLDPVAELPPHVGTVAFATENGAGEIQAHAYANVYRKLRAEGASIPDAFEGALKAAQVPPEQLTFKAKTLLRDGETIIYPGDSVTHLTGPDIVELLSRDQLDLA